MSPQSTSLLRFSLVCLGSAGGGGIRYLVSLWVPRMVGTSFPYATLIVNVAGSFLIGAIMTVGLRSNMISTTTRLFLTTGVMGGLTTYSTFNYESLEYLRGAAIGIGLLNIAATLLGCIIAGLVGLAAGEWLIAH